jgi:anthranilate synthase/aminodeoxychorismate synthase-like glutamine amidotransferase
VILFVDNFDSFSNLLVSYLQQCGATCLIKRNNDLNIDQLSKMPVKAIVISPGPQTPGKSGGLNGLIGYYHDKLPILGICLGHQAIAQFFGATIIKGRLPVHGKTTMVTHDYHPVFHDVPNPFMAMRYHSLEVRGIENTEITGIAHSEDGVIMGICHRNLPLTGLQFHPESILTKPGFQIIKNWISIHYKPEQ